MTLVIIWREMMTDERVNFSKNKCAKCGSVNFNNSDSRKTPLSLVLIALIRHEKPPT